LTLGIILSKFGQDVNVADNFFNLCPDFNSPDLPAWVKDNIKLRAFKKGTPYIYGCVFG
jgi:hypothetical protein